VSALAAAAVVGLDRLVAMKRPPAPTQTLCACLRLYVGGRDGKLTRGTYVLDRVYRDATSFSPEKAPGTLRIFCLGQSTTEGFPFQPRGGYPRWLDVFLADLLPGVRVEVINAGVCGSNSSVDLMLMSEVLGYSPDVVVLYQGLNDRGAQPGGRLRLLLGTAAEPFAHAHDALAKKSALYNLAHSKLFARSGRRRGGFGDPGLELCRRNVGRMVRLAERRGVKVVLLSQVVLEPERAPEVAAHNEALRGMEGPGAAYADAAAAFRKSMEEGAAGFPDLFADPVHPSLSGQRMLAEQVCRTLQRRGWIAPSDAWRWERLAPEPVQRKRLGLDREFMARAAFLEAMFFDVNFSDGRTQAFREHWLEQAESHSPGAAARLLKEFVAPIARDTYAEPLFELAAAFYRRRGDEARAGEVERTAAASRPAAGKRLELAGAPVIWDGGRRRAGGGPGNIRSPAHRR
jgi:lysophospholipase L1-like esterase